MENNTITKINDINKILNLIDGKIDKINILNIFIKYDTDTYNKKFKDIIDIYKTIYKFDDFDKIFGNTFNKYKDIIKYIKTYIVINNSNKNYIIFNPDVYKNVEEIKYNKKIYKNEDNTLNFRIDNKFPCSNKLINYLINYPNFINNFVKKRNSKSTILTNLWKKDVLNQPSDSLDIKKLNYKNKYDTKLYSYTNKKYKIKKQRKLEFLIKNEKIISSIRICLPNSFIICLDDSTYIHINKIIISESLTVGKYKFNNINEKIYFIIKIYENFFINKLDNYNITFNLSIKKQNIDNILYINIIDKINNKIINFTDKYIIIKYINSYKDLLYYNNIISKYINKYKIYFNILNKIKKKHIFLYMSNSEIDNFF